jgi:alpha-tubulin suppressor-like RCC1 family protein
MAQVFDSLEWETLRQARPAPHVLHSCVCARARACNCVRVAAGAFHNLALTATGHVLAWGNSDYGQLGLGSTTHVAAPAVVAELSKAGVVVLAAGGWHSGVLTAGGLAYVWGRGEHGRLGLGDDWRDRLRPAELPLEGRASQLSLGGTHSVLVTDAGQLLSCGRPSFGRLGRHDGNTNVMAPVALPPPPPGTARWFCSAASAGGRHTLALCYPLPAASSSPPAAPT